MVVTLTLLPTLVRPLMTGLTRVPTAGLTRGATVGLIVVTLESICRLGVRMMLCACATEPKTASGNAIADNAIATCSVFVCQFALKETMEPQLGQGRD
jgi:hypothetical protein